MCPQPDGDPVVPAAPADQPAAASGAARPPAAARKYVPLTPRLISADEVNKEWETLTLYRNMAIPAAGGVLVLGNVVNWYYEGFTVGPFSFYLLGQLTVRLGLVVLTLLWIQSGTVEYGYITRWIRTPTLRSRRPVQVMLSFFVLAAFFSLLMIFSGRVHVLLLLFCTYLLVDIATWKLRRDEIGAALDNADRFLRRAVPAEGDGESSEEIERDRIIAGLYGRALQVLRSYYFDHYHVSRVIATLAAMALLCIAAYAMPRASLHFGLVHVDPAAATIRLAGLDVPFDVARFIAYALFLLILLVSEMVLASWRSAMRNQLYDVRDELVNQPA